MYRFQIADQHFNTDIPATLPLCVSASSSDHLLVVMLIRRVRRMNGRQDGIQRSDGSKKKKELEGQIKCVDTVIGQHNFFRFLFASFRAVRMFLAF